MRRSVAVGRHWGLVLISGAVVIGLTGAGTTPPKATPKASPKAATKKKEVALKAEETIGEIASIIGSEYKVEGVGLVMGLDGTGSDPSPSWQRTKLINEMQKAGVTQAEKMLRSGQYSMVTVRAVIPAGVSQTDRLDVELELAPGSATTSLSGGWLINTQLAQRASTPQGVKEDRAIASVYGPVMTGNASKPDDPKVGRVLGGGHVKEAALYAISIRETRRSGKTSQLIMNVINNRFHQAEGLDQKGMATAKTEALLELRVPRTYHHNQDRYHQVLKFLPLIDNPELREDRLVRWGKELLDPNKAGVAALKLEGLGPSAAPALRPALGSNDENVRFFAAEALAYLNDGVGDNAKILADIARRKPEFRSFALKALAATDQAASLLKLRSLMAEGDPELRYGAFDALRTLDPTDPFLGKRKVMDDLPNPDDDDEMAVQIASPTRRKKPPKRDEPFSLYVVDCEGPPLIHVTRNLRSEVVVFGRDQKLVTPVVLGAGGAILLNASDGDDHVQISRITERTLDAPRSKVDSPLDMAEVIRQMANVDASYPEVVGLLMAASSQKNLPGPIAVDAIPLSNKAYDQAQLMALAMKKDNDLRKTSGSSGRSGLVDWLRSLRR